MLFVVSNLEYVFPERRCSLNTKVKIYVYLIFLYIEARPYSAFFDALVRSFINAYTKAYELTAKMATIPISRHP